MPLSAEDRLDILDVLARANWTADAKDVEGLAAHYAADGRFTGVFEARQARAVLHTWTVFACEAIGDWQSPHAEAIGRLIMQHSPSGALGVPAAQG